MRRISQLSLIAAACALIALVVYIKTTEHDTMLEFRVRDATSEAWVWNFTADIQNRAVIGFYQSNRGLIPYRFSKLRPGRWDLNISAPSYEKRTISVHIKRGKNILQAPIDMRGYEIPDLQRFYIFAQPQGRDILIELRPVGSDGKAIVNHPCVDIWLGCRVSVQMKDGVFVAERTVEGSTYGEELFSGSVPWEWDPSPDVTFRYRGRIRAADIEENEAPYRVIDYLIIVPDPRVMKKEDVSGLMSTFVDFSDTKRLTSFLDRYQDRLDYYTYRTWNVPRTQSQL